MFFLKKVFIFIAPIALFISFPVFVLWYSGEFLSFDDVDKIQNEGGYVTLLGFSYKDMPPSFKYKKIITVDPDVIFLGNSRMLEFRSEFFKQGVLSYNGGMTIENAADYKRLLDRIPPDRTPKVIIVGLDYSFFHESQGREAMYQIKSEKINNNLSDRFNSFIILLRTVYNQYFHGRFSLVKLYEAHNDKLKRIGLNAMISDNGFRDDGSYHYGETIQNLINSHPEKNGDYLFSDTLYRVEHGSKNFKNGQVVSADAVKEIDSFLQSAKDRHIYVVGLFPPYAPKVFSRVKSMGSKFAYFDLANNVISGTFSRQGFKFYNFSDVGNLGFTDDYFIDGFHGTETVYFSLFAKMLENDVVLSKYTDLDYLKNALAHPCNKYEIFCYGSNN